LRLLALYGDTKGEGEASREEKQAASEAEALSLEALEEALGMAQQKGINSLEEIRLKAASTAAKRAEKAERKANRNEARRIAEEAGAMHPPAPPAEGGNDETKSASESGGSSRGLPMEASRGLPGGLEGGLEGGSAAALGHGEVGHGEVGRGSSSDSDSDSKEDEAVMMQVVAAELSSGGGVLGDSCPYMVINHYNHWRWSPR